MTTRLNPIAELGAFQDRIGDAGAIVSFTGVVRSRSGLGDVLSLHLQSHPTLTEQGIATAIDTAHARWPLTASLVRHRIGEIGPHEPIVFVATAANHRRAAFEAADFLMDYLKTEAIFWKKEITATGTTWIEPKENDYKDRARWHARTETTKCTE
ncbi:MAG: molybdenum cofactor biosynthesis protein MoaE [Hyphomonas sp.]|uniref:molybdenum cofactor biosynthesis protein MoaE n=1 Tax=Hyphomonas sp. TaxID=87 RepID=UPI00300241A7